MSAYFMNASNWGAFFIKNRKTNNKLNLACYHVKTGSQKMLLEIFRGCFDQTFGWISQISFEVDVSGIKILESSAGQCVHLAFNLLDLAALEGVGLLKVC